MNCPKDSRSNLQNMWSFKTEKQFIDGSWEFPWHEAPSSEGSWATSGYHLHSAPRHHGTRGTGHRAQFQFHWLLKNVYGYGGWLRKAASPRCLKVHRVSLSIWGPSFSGKFENELLKEPTIVSSYWIQKISPAIIMWQFLNPSIIFPRISFSVQWITT